MTGKGVAAGTRGDASAAPAHLEMSRKIVQLQGICKYFPGVRANEDINLEIAEGEIHALCGENGAGKSTLMKILYGMQQPDEGSMVVKGEEVRFHSPRDAINYGIGMVHQHFMLADNLSVLENIILGSEPSTLGRIEWSSAEEQVQELCNSYGLFADIHDPVENLAVGQRQKVEIIKALFRGVDILILDEPTAVLVPQEVEDLFVAMREMKEQGKTLLFIDHKLDEVLEISDRITVLRAGRSITTLDKADTTPSDLAEFMIGSELPTPEIYEDTTTDRVLLSVSNLSLAADEGKNLLSDINISIRQGEIVGIAGVEGNGQTELVEVLLGTRRQSYGDIVLGDEDITDWPTRRRREQQLGYIPEDRHRMGLLLPSPLWENAMLGHHKRSPFSKKSFWLLPVAARQRCSDIVADFDVRTPSVKVAADALSGGNQQKLIIGREMSMHPKVLISAHPTRGIDVGAQAAVWDDLRLAKKEGLAVLLISADLDELIGLSDRLLVILRGEIVAELDPAEVTPRDLGSYMTGAVAQESDSQTEDSETGESGTES